MTRHLAPINYLAVEINNQPTTQTIPGWAMKLHTSKNIWYDWWHYGGIVREVWLSVKNSIFIRRQQIATLIEGKVAVVRDSLFLENHSEQTLPVRITLKVYSEEGGPAVAAVGQRVSLTPGSQSETLNLHLDPVNLWDFDNPYLYRMEAGLEDAGGRRLDTHVERFGARIVEIRGRGLYLNGQRVRLSGMTRHETSPWEGLAETRGTMKHDYDEMKNLQATLTRPVHYPQNPYILDYCDENGILLIPEIPVWQFSDKQLADPKVIALAEQMMGEMITQDFNHPSIFAWSVCNESATDTRAAKGLSAAVLGAGQPQIITQNPQQRAAGIDLQAHRFSIKSELKVLLHRTPPEVERMDGGRSAAISVSYRLSMTKAETLAVM